MTTGVNGQTAVDREYGNRLLNSLLMGTTIGAGGMGLWHAIKGIKEKQKSKQQNIEELAATPPSFVSNPVKQANNAALMAALPVGGAGIGALVGALRAQKGKRLSGALTGAAAGGAVGGGLGLAGAGLSSFPQISEALGRATREGVSMPSTGGKALPTPQTNLQGALMDVGVPALAVLGAGGGAAAVNSMLKEDDTKENRNAVTDARDEYFKTLLNHSGEKTAFSAALDLVYEKYVEKKAAPIDPSNDPGWFWRTFVNNPAAGPNSTGNFWDGAANIGVQKPMAIALASLAAGGVFGGKYMYDKTRAASKNKLLLAARQARERAQGLNAPWINPVELATVKDLATQKELPHEQGV